MVLELLEDWPRPDMKGEGPAQECGQWRGVTRASWAPRTRETPAKGPSARQVVINPQKVKLDHSGGHGPRPTVNMGIGHHNHPSGDVQPIVQCNSGHSAGDWVEHFMGGKSQALLNLLLGDVHEAERVNDHLHGGVVAAPCGGVRAVL